MADRFDFEELIMSCWHVTDDIKTIADYVNTIELPSEAHIKLYTMLIGTKELYDLRFRILTDMFSDMIQSGVITSEKF